MIEILLFIPAIVAFAILTLRFVRLDKGPTGEFAVILFFVFIVLLGFSL